jgi:hypothetical protein
VLHFDLYNTTVKNNGNITVDDFAPFSHDAQSGPGLPPTNVDVPEPSTIAILGLGLLGIGLARRKSRA